MDDNSNGQPGGIISPGQSASPPPINEGQQQAAPQPQPQQQPQYQSPQPQAQPEPHQRFSYPKPKRSKAPKIVLIILLVLAIGGGVAYWFLAGPGHKKESAKQSSTSSSSSSSSQSSGSSSGQATNNADGTKTYKSAKLNLELTYLNTWKLSENSDKSEIILTSPSVTYATKDGGTTDGVFTFKVRNGLLPDAMKTTIQNAVAIKDSEVIAYSQPAAEQRQYTNVSFAGNATNMNFFIVTGSVAFKAGEAFGSSIDTQGSVYLFAGGFGTDAKDSLVFDSVPVASFTGSEVYAQAIKIVESLKTN